MDKEDAFKMTGPLSDKDRRLFEHLSQFPSEHKKAFIEQVLSQRTRYLMVVLEDIYQSQNASAVVRTCECMGLQDVAIVENRSKFVYNRRVLKGSEKWMTFHRYNDKHSDNTQVAFRQLRAAGYRIFAADPAPEAISMEDIDMAAGPVAIVFGNELHGLSAGTRALADGLIKVPMYGFTESMNISVSVAMVLQCLLSKLRHSDIDFHLNEEDKEVLRLSWYKKIVKRSDILEREFMRSID